MKILAKVVCIIMFIFYFCAWAFTEKKVNESCLISSSIYFLCFILLYIFS